MRLLRNAGSDRVVDELRSGLSSVGMELDVASPALSLFAFDATQELLGLDLCVPIDTRSIADKDVHSIGAGTLLACLATSIKRDEVEKLAEGLVTWHKELAPVGDVQCVFRDSAFEDDVTKSNLAAILHQHGHTNVRSL